MPLPRKPLRLTALLPLMLLSQACQHPSTASSIARTERPKLPTLPPELTRTEKLTPLSGKTSGELVTVDKGWLGEVVERFAEAIGAVERGNRRSNAVRQERRCVAALFETGATSPECSK